jgi:hypothetical protein
MRNWLMFMEAGKPNSAAWAENQKNQNFTNVKVGRSETRRAGGADEA